jgi:hypothetical protein
VGRPCTQCTEVRSVCQRRLCHTLVYAVYVLRAVRLILRPAPLRLAPRTQAFFSAKLLEQIMAARGLLLTEREIYTPSAATAGEDSEGLCHVNGSAPWGEDLLQECTALIEQADAARLADPDGAAKDSRGGGGVEAFDKLWRQIRKTEQVCQTCTAVGLATSCPYVGISPYILASKPIRGTNVLRHPYTRKVANSP